MAVATAPETLRESQRNLNRRHRLLIDGEWVEPASGRTFKTLNPANGEPLAEIAAGEAPDIDRAVIAARRAFERGPWSRLKPSERQRLIWRLADRMEECLEELAQLETLDNGKPLSVSRAADVPLSIEHMRYFAGWATKIEGETIPVSVPYAPGARYFNYTLREPVGVVGQIIPWNFPLLMAAWKLGPALAAGNCVVLKPAEQTPLSALRLGELIQEVGFPPGVVNIVTGFGETAGAALAAHPDVDKVAFTGSTEVGKQIVQASAGNLKRVSLELGGKSPNIVFRDADLDAAAQGAAAAIFFNHGQCCCAGSRLFVEKPAYDQVVDRLGELSEKIRLGPGWDPATEMGPLVSEEQLRALRATWTPAAPRGRASSAAVAASTASSQAATSCSRRSSPMYAATCESCGKRSSVPSSPLPRSPTWKRRSRPATILPTAWRPGSGRATSAKRTRQRRR